MCLRSLCVVCCSLLDRYVCMRCVYLVADCCFVDGCAAGCCLLCDGCCLAVCGLLFVVRFVLWVLCCMLLCVLVAVCCSLVVVCC